MMVPPHLQVLQSRCVARPRPCVAILNGCSAVWRIVILSVCLMLKDLASRPQLGLKLPLSVVLGGR